MKSNEIIRNEFLKIVDNQIRMNKPPEAALTFTRLKKEGYSASDAKKLIAQCIAVEYFVMMKYKKPYDNERYIRNLNNLPEDASGD